MNVSTRIRAPSRAASGYLPPLALPASAAAFVLFGLGPNFTLAALALTALLIGVALLWRPGEPPAFVFSYIYQWTQASIAIFYANWLGLSIDELPGMRTESMTYATVLSLIGLVAVAIGVRLGSGPRSAAFAEQVRVSLANKNASVWFRLFAGVWLVATAAQVFAYVVPGLSQILLAAAKLKWAGYVLFTAATFLQRRANRTLWAGVFIFEFILSIGGYFSAFKEIFFYTFIALATANVRVTAGRAVAGAIMFSVLLTLGVVWTAVKSDYRDIISGGTHEQIVTLGFSERIGVLLDLVSSLDESKIESADRALIERIAYVEFFGAVLDHVPSTIAHENGARWVDAVSRPFMPRLFFPDKSILEDSAVTKEYTGIILAGASEGTSISIGYMGETYIDFGAAGMMLALLGFGVALGSFYRLMISTQSMSPALGMAIVCPMLVQGFTLESALASLIGGLAVYALVSLLVVRFVIPRLPRKYRT